MEDAKLAVSTGVDGVDVVIGTSSFLREHSHGKDMDYITKTAIEVINYIKRHAAPYAPGSCRFTDRRTARAVKSASRPRTPSGPTSSICCRSTRLLTGWA